MTVTPSLAFRFRALSKSLAPVVKVILSASVKVTVEPVSKSALLTSIPVAAVVLPIIKPPSILLNKRISAASMAKLPALSKPTSTAPF